MHEFQQRIEHPIRNAQFSVRLLHVLQGLNQQRTPAPRMYAEKGESQGFFLGLARQGGESRLYSRSGCGRCRESRRGSMASRTSCTVEGLSRQRITRRLAPMQSVTEGDGTAPIATRAWTFVRGSIPDCRCPSVFYKGPSQCGAHQAQTEDRDRAFGSHGAGLWLGNIGHSWMVKLGYSSILYPRPSA